MRLSAIIFFELIIYLCDASDNYRSFQEDNKLQYWKTRKLSHQPVLDNVKGLTPTSRLFNWDHLPTTPLIATTTTRSLLLNNKIYSKIGINENNPKKHVTKKPRKLSKDSHKNDTPGNTSKPKKKRKNCNRPKNKNKKRCRKARNRKTTENNILEITTAKNTHVFQLNAENNSTIKELIARLNENPELDYSSFLNKSHYLNNKLSTNIKPPSNRNHTNDIRISKVNVYPHSHIGKNETNSESNDIFYEQLNTNNNEIKYSSILKTTTGAPLIKRNITMARLMNDLNMMNNEFSDLYSSNKIPSKSFHKKYKEVILNNDNCDCAHICHNSNRKGKVTKCSCLSGFMLNEDGKTCRDINECKEDKNICSGTCHNTLGSYYCGCQEGFRLADDFKSCEDINECRLRNGHGPCQDTCENTFGSYKCGCQNLKGTKLASDQHTCEDVDECSENRAGCSHNCINTLGRSFCTCPLGMELGLDWKTCHDIDECRDEDIKKQCKYGCINTIGSYFCINPMQNDQSFPSDAPDHIACPPLFPPPHGFIQCSREKASFVKTKSKNGRLRITNRPGSYCELICPHSFKQFGEYFLTCGTEGTWLGPKSGKCIPFLKPRIRCPKNLIYTLEENQNNIHVNLTKPKSNTKWNNIKAIPSWAKELHGVLEKGDHNITFTAYNPISKLSASCFFSISVK